MEFAYNNAPSATTSVSPFFTNKRYHPNITVHPKHDIASSRAHDFAIDLDELQSTLKAEISMAQQYYQKSTNVQCSPALNFKVIDGELEYEISRIVNSKIDHQWACKLLYKVIWLRYENARDKSKWISISKLTHAANLVSDFHIVYPTKPGPLPLS